jgi:hypothetical protein
MMRGSPNWPSGRRPFPRPVSTGSSLRGIARRTLAASLAAGILIAGGQSVAGHSVGHFPSYYPDEIRIDTIDPTAAGKGLVEASLHAYLGAAPSFAGPLPGHVRAVKSLGSVLVLSLDPASARLASADTRCATLRGVLAALSEARADGFVFHPYPITPYHDDYLFHVDRAEAARASVSRPSGTLPSIKIGAKGPLAAALVRARWGGSTEGAEITLEQVVVDDLLAGSAVQFAVWPGPPWVKEGWFQAYRLLGPGSGAEARQAAEQGFDRLVNGITVGPEERVDLERSLVASLTSGCERVVVGYTLKEEYVSEIYPAGAENMAHDALYGLNAPIFLRTAKLKEYPWNGKLHLGLRDRARAAWNPVAGFTDGAGRLIWAGIGDPAMIAFPVNASWMPNRVQAEVTSVAGRSGGVTVPADALRPEPGTGRLNRVADRTFSSAKVAYEVLASPFEDGTEMEVADLLYPFAFTYRWGARPGADNNVHEPALAPVLAMMQERLVGLKVVRVEKTTHEIAEGLKVIQKTPVIEVYLKDPPKDERQAAALAPPWSTVPWHLLALMEEAVIRGYAAFSEEEARRRKVPWLDLARDPALLAKLQDLAKHFERERYRPEALRDLVTPEEAEARWRSLRTFAEKRRHLLVANGPYRLKEWTPDSVVLEAVREITYPLGFGTFDRFVNPPRAVVEGATTEADSITVRAGVEMTLKMGRDYRLVKEPLLRTTARGTQGLLVASRYLVINGEGKVIKLDKMIWGEDGRFTVSLPRHLPPGRYEVVLGIILDGNAVDPSIARVEFRSP